MNERLDQRSSRRAALAVYGGIALAVFTALVMLCARDRARDYFQSIANRRATTTTSARKTTNDSATSQSESRSTNVPLQPERGRIEAESRRRIGQVTGVEAAPDVRSTSNTGVYFPASPIPTYSGITTTPGLLTASTAPFLGAADGSLRDLSAPPLAPIVGAPATSAAVAAVPNPSSNAALESLPLPTSDALVVPQTPALQPSISPEATRSAPFVAPSEIAAMRFDQFVQAGTISLADVRIMVLRNNKDIAVIEQAPQMSAAAIAAESAVFDPVFNIALQGGRYYRQVATQIQGLGINSDVLQTSFWQPLNGLNHTYFEKLFVTGGKMQVGVGQSFLRYNPVGDFVLVNPSFQASFNLLLEQPLFRGRGPAATTAQVRIAQANYQRSQHAFRATVNQILRDAEAAYWDTYAAFQEYEARDAALARAWQTVERERGRLQLGEGSIPDVAQAEEQCEMFRIARAEAETRRLAAQRTLRRLMGIAADDPRPIIPATMPYDAPLELDLAYAECEARQRPEFAAQAAAVVAAEAELARRRNGLLPDLSARAIYSATGLNNHLDEAFHTASTAHYQDWTAGIVYRQPIGRRSDRALADRAVAALAAESARLRQLEHEVLHQLRNAYENLQAGQQMLQLHMRRREAAALQAEARRELYLENQAALREQLDAELRFAAAVFDESTARVNYQRALTEWNFARGASADGDLIVDR